MKAISCLLVAILCYQVLADPAVFETWQKFQKNFEKSYKSPAEAVIRYAIFAKNLKNIEEHNKCYENGEVSWKKGINQFSDWKPEEFKEYINEFESNNVNLTRASRLGNFHIPKSLDWRTKGIVTPVKSEGKCTASWAFSATGALEAQFKLVKNQSLSFSEQNLIDCANKAFGPYTSLGCVSGEIYDALKYVKYEGISTETNYPYEAHDGKCRPKTEVYKTNDYIIVPDDEDELQVALATIGPISATMEATDNLQMYAGGVLIDEKCVTGYLNRAVLVAGYGREHGEDYWLIKNSWGTKWGEDGYFKLVRGVNNCGISDLALFPILLK